MRASQRAVAALALVALVHSLALALPLPIPEGALPLLSPMAMTVPAVVVYRLSRSRPADRVWLSPLAAGILLLALSALTRSGIPWPDPAEVVFAADLLAVTGTAALLAALLRSLRLRLGLGRIGVYVLLDGLAGAMAGAAAAALLLAPVVQQVWDGSWASVLSLGQAVVAAVLVAAALGALGLVGASQVRQFGTWTVGMVLLAVADAVQASRTDAGQLTVGTWLDAVPVLAVVLLALGALGSVQHDGEGTPGPWSMAVPTSAAVVAVLALTLAPAWHVNVLPTILALATLATCAARFVLVFLQLRELAAIREQAMTDELTGIANRRALYEHLDDLLGASPAGEATPRTAFAVALIDLDHFKEVNDTLGHAMGDAVLKGVTARFEAALAELETPYLFARLGGDEFAIVLHEVGTREAALIVGDALEQSLQDPLDLSGVELHAQASIGLALAPEHGENRSEILFAADAAMYSAKAAGVSVRFHAPKSAEKTRQFGVAEALYRALEQNEIVVEYQPIMTLEGELVGAEALARWDHPDGERLGPEDFMVAAQRHRMTGAIAERVLSLALTDRAHWRADGYEIGVTVNISVADLRDDAVVTTIANALLAHRVPPHALTIDINEVGLMADLERLSPIITALRDLGVRLALDDFGSGGTSLRALKELPFDDLKLFGEFTQDVASRARTADLVRAQADVAHALGKRLVAEGVESAAVLSRLRDLGCDLAQGWFVGRPVSSADFESRYVRSSTPVAEPERPGARGAGAHALRDDVRTERY